MKDIEVLENERDLKYVTYLKVLHNRVDTFPTSVKEDEWQGVLFYCVCDFFFYIF